LLNDVPELEAKALFEHLLAGGAAPEAQNAAHVPTPGAELATPPWSAERSVLPAGP
jgi:hypothetical protein